MSTSSASGLDPARRDAREESLGSRRSEAPVPSLATQSSEAPVPSLATQSSEAPVPSLVTERRHALGPDAVPEQLPSDDLGRATALHARLVCAAATLRTASRDLAHLLARLDRDRLYRQLGYGSTREYALAELDLTARQATDLLALGRRLSALPGLDRALCGGEIGWSKAREVARVATVETEDAWLRRASEVSSRVLEKHVAACRRGDLPPTPERVREEALLPARKVLRFELEPADANLVTDALALLRERSGLGRDEVDDGALLAQALQRVVHEVGAEGVAGGGAGDSDGGAAGDSDGGTMEDTVGDSVAEMVGDKAGGTADSTPCGGRHLVVLQHCPACSRTAGLEIPIDETHVGLATCDAELVEMRAGSERGRLTRAIPPRIRRAVLLRDQRACVVPGCTNRLWLDLHHVRPRAQGGAHSEDNLVTLCSAHHHAIHDGQLALRATEVPGVVEVERANGAVARVRLGEGAIEGGGPLPAKVLFSWGFRGYRV